MTHDIVEMANSFHKQDVHQHHTDMHGSVHSLHGAAGQGHNMSMTVSNILVAFSKYGESCYSCLIYLVYKFILIFIFILVSWGLHGIYIVLVVESDGCGRICWIILCDFYYGLTL